jgi:hypothetical protein
MCYVPFVAFKVDEVGINFGVFEFSDVGQYRIEFFADFEIIADVAYSAISSESGVVFNIQEPSSSDGTDFVLVVSSSGSGLIEPSVNSWYSNGSEAVVTASPCKGWVFSYWLLDDVNVGNSNPITFKMDTGHNIIAIFTKKSPPTVFDISMEIIALIVTIAAIIIFVSIWFLK